MKRFTDRLEVSVGIDRAEPEVGGTGRVAAEWKGVQIGPFSVGNPLSVRFETRSFMLADSPWRRIGTIKAVTAIIRG